MQVASLRYFDAHGAFARLLREMTGLTLPGTSRALCSTTTSSAFLSGTAAASSRASACAASFFAGLFAAAGGARTFFRGAEAARRARLGAAFFGAGFRERGAISKSRS